jgi:hypothetical protein
MKPLRILALTALLAAMSGLALAADDDIDALEHQAAANDAGNAVAPAQTIDADQATSNLRGFAQLELSRTLSSPSHWSKMLGRLEFGKQGKTDSGLKWKLSARVDYDAVFATTSFYGADVRRDQQFNVVLRENYIDTSIGDWDVRLGRQHVIWGEMVGLFFADVVSARDMREFILPEFNILRIPQWAARAEYFRDDFHGELLWIPVASYDETGKPGSEFFPWQPLDLGYLNEVKPAAKLRNGNYGARGTWLDNGWDLSAFYYRSMDAAATFYQTGNGTFYEARHDRISQLGGTLAKDFGSLVLKAEAVLTRGRQLTVLRPDADGVTPQNTFDWVVGLDFPFQSDTRFNIQAFQSIITNHDPDVIRKKRESGYSLLLHGKLAPDLEAEVLWVASLDRNDWMLRPKLNWNFQKNWRLVLGVDAFHGPAMGLFGRYNARDRVYSELRRSF